MQSWRNLLRIKKIQKKRWNFDGTEAPALSYPEIYSQTFQLHEPLQPLFCCVMQRSACNQKHLPNSHIPFHLTSRTVLWRRHWNFSIFCIRNWRLIRCTDTHLQSGLLVRLRQEDDLGPTVQASLGNKTRSCLSKVLFQRSEVYREKQLFKLTQPVSDRAGILHQSLYSAQQSSPILHFCLWPQCFML